MKALVTGSKGFIGKHLVLRLKENDYEVLEYGRNDDDLEEKINDVDIIFHLAGINRTNNLNDFQSVNVGLTEEIIRLIKKTERFIPIVFSSTKQVFSDNPYGKSKKNAEELLLKFNEDYQNPTYIFRLPGVFGKWSKPYYNTVVATFIDQLHHNENPTIDDANSALELIYIDRVIDMFVESMNHKLKPGVQEINNTYQLSVGELADYLIDIHRSDLNCMIPDLKSPLIKDLYSTYISFKPMDDLEKKLKMNKDDRGSFTEILKTLSDGQFSVNITKPGIIKGNHYHHHKHEKFIVVSGHALIQLRNIKSGQMSEISASEETLVIIDIPPGAVHNIRNVGETDLVTLMWANEVFDANAPDTIYEKV